MSVCTSILAVYVVLVTDILVLLTERDQKYRLATLQEYRVRNKNRSRYKKHWYFNTIISLISVHERVRRYCRPFLAQCRVRAVIMEQLQEPTRYCAL